MHTNIYTKYKLKQTKKRNICQKSQNWLCVATVNDWMLETEPPTQLEQYKKINNKIYNKQYNLVNKMSEW